MLDVARRVWDPRMIYDLMLDLLAEGSYQALKGLPLPGGRIKVHGTIAGAAALSGLVGAFPLPLVDILPIRALRIALLVRLSEVEQGVADWGTARQFVMQSHALNLLPLLARQMLKLWPGAGTAISALVAALGTMALGYFASGRPLSEGEQR